MNEPNPGAQVDRDARAAIHAAIGLFALTLPYLPRLGAAAFAAMATIGNLFLLPRLAIGRRIIGAGTVSPRNGIVLYPVTVFLLILALPYPAEAMAAWGILAAGDASASFFGRRRPQPRLPWNAQKSAVGLAAFLIAGTLGATLLRATIPGRNGFFDSAVVDLLACACAGFCESLRLRIDDNVRIGVATAAVYLVAAG